MKIGAGCANSASPVASMGPLYRVTLILFSLNWISLSFFLFHFWYIVRLFLSLSLVLLLLPLLPLLPLLLFDILLRKDNKKKQKKKKERKCRLFPCRYDRTIYRVGNSTVDPLWGITSSWADRWSRPYRPYSHTHTLSHRGANVIDRSIAAVSVVATHIYSQRRSRPAWNSCLRASIYNIYICTVHFLFKRIVSAGVVVL